MIYRTFGKTGLRVSAIGFGGAPFAGVNRASDWDPYTAEGRKTAITTVHRAVERGVSYFDTAPGYGDGHSESIIGEALSSGGRREKVIVATKCPWGNATPERIRESVEGSLRRLRTDYLDVMQLHGGASEVDVPHTLETLLPELERLRTDGLVRYVGFTVEEAWPARPLIASAWFDVIQLRYNVIYQAAALHALPEAKEAQMGVAVMRPLTSGVFQRQLRYLMPELASEQIYALALRFVLGDSRMHVANVGMRWAHEVDLNCDLADTFEIPVDIAELPRMTLDVYRAEDEERVLSGPPGAS